MTGCEQFQARMSELFDGELTAAAAAECEAHQRACAGCRERYAAFVQPLGWLRDDDLLAPEAGMEARLRARLERELPAPNPSRLLSWRVAPWRPLAVAAVLLLVAGVAFQLRGASVVASGWLSDEHCSAAYATHPADHTRQCMLAARCAAAGFGLIDSQGRFVRFDSQGSRSAVAALRATSQDDHLWATVYARRGFTSVLRVSRLELSPPPTAVADVPQPVQLAAAH